MSAHPEGQRGGSTWGAITDDGIEAAASLIGTQLRRDRMQWVTEANADAIRHFAWGVGDNNPLWLDDTYAEHSPWGSILAPPCFLYAVDYTVVAPKLPGVQWIYAGTDWTWFDVVRKGDRFTVDARLISQEVKHGRRFPRWLLQTGEIQYRNQRDELIAVALGRCARTPRVNAGERAMAGTAATPRSYSPDELAEIEALALAEQSRGSEPLYWEDVAVGDRVPTMVKGPLSIVDILAWDSATQGAMPYGGAHGDAVRYRARHDDYHLNPLTGAKDAAGRGHLEAATGRDVGMGGAYDVGPQRISWAQHMLTNWMGDHGFLHRLDVAVRQPNLVGDTTWWHGEITRKRQLPHLDLVDVSVTALNHAGEATANGTASVALPSRERGPVRLPVG